MNRLSRICCLAGAAIVLSFASPVSADLSELTSPSVPFAKNYPASAKAKVNAALTQKGCTFLGGFGLNSWTSLRYSGDTLALNQFLDSLVKCPGATVHVSLKKLVDDCDWRVGHDFFRNSFQ